MKDFYDYEFVSLSDIEEVTCECDFDSALANDDEFENLQEHEATIAVAEVLEELGYKLELEV